MTDQPEPQPADSQPETAGQPSASPSADELAAMLAEAEQRGYLRGRNEAITSRLDSPQLLEEPEEPVSVTILGNLRPSVW